MECIFERAPGYTCTARRNNSLSSRGRLRAYGFIAVVCLSIASAFAAAGAWLILPFAGLEVALLYAVWRYLERHADDYERLTIDGDMLVLETAEAGLARTWRFNRQWAQVEHAPDGSWLALRYHGRDIAFGRHLTSEQRLRVAGELKEQLRSR